MDPSIRYPITMTLDNGLESLEARKMRIKDGCPSYQDLLHYCACTEMDRDALNVRVVAHWERVAKDCRERLDAVSSQGLGLEEEVMASRKLIELHEQNGERLRRQVARLSMEVDNCKTRHEEELREMRARHAKKMVEVRVRLMDTQAELDELRLRRLPKPLQASVPHLDEDFETCLNTKAPSTTGDDSECCTPELEEDKQECPPPPKKTCLHMKKRWLEETKREEERVLRKIVEESPEAKTQEDKLYASDEWSSDTLL